MMAWKYDDNNILIEPIYYIQELDKEGNVIEPSFKYTTVSPLSDGNTGTIPYRPRFDIDKQKWVEDMTEEEISQWKKDNELVVKEQSNEEKLKEENKKLWDTVELLLKDSGRIPNKERGV